MTDRKRNSHRANARTRLFAGDPAKKTKQGVTKPHLDQTVLKPPERRRNGSRTLMIERGTKKKTKELLSLLSASLSLLSDHETEEKRESVSYHTRRTSNLSKRQRVGRISYSAKKEDVWVHVYEQDVIVTGRWKRAR